MRLRRISLGGVLAVGAVAVLASAVLGTPGASGADAVTGSVLIIAPHPDDDVIIAAGIADDNVDVTVAYMTNGDWCETITVGVGTKNNLDYCGVAVPDIGVTRQGEAVAGQALLDQAENDLRFLGYPDGDLTRVWNSNPLHTLRTETYAERGLGGTDWYDYRTGSGEDHAPYERDALIADVVALIEDVQPDHIFTTSRYDRHSDHDTTYNVVKFAIEQIISDDDSFVTTLHSTIVHVRNSDCWGWPHSSDPTSDLDPDCAGTTGTVETWIVTCSTKGTTNCPLVWDDREQFVVPSSMQTPVNSNLKYQALEAHDSQTGFEGGFILRWANRDEIFWAEPLAWGPTGVDDAYSVEEGGDLNVPATGVLGNDADGLVGGTITAMWVSGPSNGAAFTLNADGSFSYSHDGSETSSDSFTYRPSQGGVLGSVATVTLTVDPVNDAPVAVDDGPFNVDAGGVLVKTAPGVLFNDSDPEGSGLTAVLKTGPSNGAAFALNADGSFTYTHDGSQTDSDSFTYQAKDTGGELSNVATVSITVGLGPIHLTGLVDVSQGKWYLYDEAGVLDTSFFFGNPGDYPFMGDWDGDGVETPGLYRQSDGFVYIKNTNAVGNADISFFFGNPGDVPIAGDFNGDGFDTVSIYRPSNQRFFIINELGQDGGGLGEADVFYTFGNPGDKPFVGDFDGDGVETAGLHRESTGLVYFRNSHTPGNADNEFLFGNPGDRLVAGDWTGDRVFTPALFRPTSTIMYFKYTNSQGNADNEFVPTPANPTWLPVSGKR